MEAALKAELKQEISRIVDLMIQAEAIREQIASLKKDIKTEYGLPVATITKVASIVRKQNLEEEEEKWWVEKGMVDHPPHYNKGIETSEYIRSWEMNWDQANVVKYVTRYNLKHADKDLQCQDLRKARHYLDRLIESYETN